jgi:hypothetical protein
MRKLLMMGTIGTLAAFATSMVTAQDGNEVSIARSYEVTGFEQVSVVGPHHVLISVGPAYSVSVEGPQETLDLTEVVVEDGRLKIQPKDDWWERGGRREWERWRDYKAATYHVTLPRISGVSLMGGGNMSVDRVEGAEFSASVAGSGDLDVATLRVDDARFSIAGSGDLIARGSARNSRVSIAGSGNLRAGDVTSNDASISIAGSGNVALRVEDAARVSIVGSGDVEISGPARCSVSRFGGGRVRCGGENVVS